MTIIYDDIEESWTFPTSSQDVQDFYDFDISWFQGNYPHLRYGQAFIGAFHKDGIQYPDPKIFYESDTQKAKQMIIDKYLKDYINA